MTRPTIPLESCDVWTFAPLSTDEIIRLGLLLGALCAVFAAVISVLICIWLMPRKVNHDAMD